MAKKMLMTVLLVLVGLAMGLTMGAKAPDCGGINQDCQLDPVKHVCCKLGDENVTFVNKCFCNTNSGTILFEGDCK